MAEFDPDAYLGKQSGFDPDAYLAKTSPAPQEKSGFPARSFSKDIKDFGYGAATSILGTPGELESLGLKAGQFMGLAPKDEKPLLPGISDVQSDAEKYLGIQPRTGSVVTAGEYAPAAVALAPAGGKLASALVAPVERALKPVGELASKVGTGVSDIAKNLNPRTAIEKLGKPTSISDVGEKIQSKVEGALNDLIKKRKPAADKLFGEYLSKGKAVENKILEDYRKGLSEYYAKGVAAGKMSPEQINAVQKAADRLSGRAPELGTAQKEAAAAREAEKQAEVAAQGRKIPPRGGAETPKKADRIPLGIGALEKERRVWNDIANGYDVKGAEGITAQAARDISDLLTKSIRKYVKAPFDAAIEGYQKLSEPINRFNTALGKKVTTKAGEYLPDIAKTDPAQVPRAFFKSRRGVQELKELSRDPKFVEQAAKEHVANDLAAAKTSDEITEYAQKNRDWLNEFPALQKQLTDAAKSLKTAERAKTAGKYGAAGLVGAGFYNKLKGML